MGGTAAKKFFALAAMLAVFAAGASKDLCAKFSKAVQEMEVEGKIGLLARDYLTGRSAQNPPAVKFEKFDGAETITGGVQHCNSRGDCPKASREHKDGYTRDCCACSFCPFRRRNHVNTTTQKSRRRIFTFSPTPLFSVIGRGERIRTSDLMDPNHAR